MNAVDLGRRGVHASVDDVPSAEDDCEHERGDDDARPVRGDPMPQRGPGSRLSLRRRRAEGDVRRGSGRRDPVGEAEPHRGREASRRSRPARPAPSWAAAAAAGAVGSPTIGRGASGPVSTGATTAGTADFGAPGFGVSGEYGVARRAPAPAGTRSFNAAWQRLHVFQASGTRYPQLWQARTDRVSTGPRPDRRWISARRVLGVRGSVTSRAAKPGYPADGHPAGMPRWHPRGGRRSRSGSRAPMPASGTGGRRPPT